MFWPTIGSRPANASNLWPASAIPGAELTAAFVTPVSVSIK